MSNANSCYKNGKGSCLRPFVDIHIHSRAYECPLKASGFRLKMFNAASVYKCQK